MSDQLLFDLGTSERPARQRRGGPLAFVVVAVLLVAVGAAVLLLRDQPSGWVRKATAYSEQQQAMVTATGPCATVTLVGTMRYERSTGGAGSSRRFRAVRLDNPSMTLSTSATCAADAPGQEVSGVRMSQRWEVPGGRPVGRRSATFPSSGQTFSQSRAGSSIRAAGFTARGRACLQATPALTMTVGEAALAAPLHAVQVCAR